MPAKRTSSDKARTMPLNRRVETAMHMEALTGLSVNWQSGHGSFRTEDEKIFCFINREGDLALKLPEERIASLVESGEARFLKMGARTMREWAVMPVPQSRHELGVLEEAKAFVASLPKVVKRVGKKRAGR